MIYNKPVTVSGTPRLLFVLDSADDTVSSDTYAYYDPSFDIGRYGRGRMFTVSSFFYATETVYEV